MSEAPSDRQRRPNRLIGEKSPYLQQHAYNPVQWMPWGEEAFAEARRRDVPVFLSIGYSTCHWCHVMERESFEDEATASLLNELYVPVKLDREERPDIDRVYMSAVQALTGQGGWPLSVWLTPEREPFYGGTYFPPQGRGGRPGFPEVLRQLAGAWRQRREQCLDSGGKLTEVLRQQMQLGAAGGALDAAWLEEAASQYAAIYDRSHGGFGAAPKFPRPAVFSFLLRHFYRSGDLGSLEMTVATLRAMVAGGIYDQLGGGFHRYAVDAYWRVPHFEKMLYDQAQLVTALVECYQAAGADDLADAARQTVEYVLRDLRDEAGGFYSAEDADSAESAEKPDHRVEGAFYLWGLDEVGAVVGSEDLELVAAAFGLEERGNTLSDPQGEFGTRNVLYRKLSVPELTQRLGADESSARERLDVARAALLAVRGRRPRPHLDDKIVTAWNGLMISALSKAGRALAEPRYVEAAATAASFLRRRLWDAESGVLLRRFRDGEARFAGQLDDFAFLIQGLLDLYEAGHDTAWLEWAALLQDRQDRLFADGERGGYFDAPPGDELLLVRGRDVHDGAEPSGNAVAASNLVRLARLLGRADWQDAAEALLTGFAGILERAGQAAPQMLAGLDLLLSEPVEIVVAGALDDPGTRALFAIVDRSFLPHAVVHAADGAAGQSWLGERLELLREMRPIDGRAAAYVCRDYSCQAPTTDPSRLETMLAAQQPSR